MRIMWEAFKNPYVWDPPQTNAICITVFWAQASVYFKNYSGDCKMDPGLSTAGLKTKLFWLDKDKALLLILSTIYS